MQRKRPQIGSGSTPWYLWTQLKTRRIPWKVNRLRWFRNKQHHICISLTSLRSSSFGQIHGNWKCVTKNVHLSKSILIYLSICPCVHLSIYLSIYLTNKRIYLSILLCIYVSVYLFNSIATCIYLPMDPIYPIYLIYVISLIYPIQSNLSVYQTYLSVCLSIDLSNLSIYLSVYLCIYLSDCLSMYLSFLYPSIYLSVSLYLLIYRYIDPCIYFMYLSIYLSVCLSVYLYFSSI